MNDETEYAIELARHLGREEATTKFLLIINELSAKDPLKPEQMFFILKKLSENGS